MALKECVACAEEIQEGASLCKFCGTMQNDTRFQRRAETSAKSVSSSRTKRRIAFIASAIGVGLLVVVITSLSGQNPKAQHSNSNSSKPNSSNSTLSDVAQSDSAAATVEDSDPEPEPAQPAKESSDTILARLSAASAKSPSTGSWFFDGYTTLTETTTTDLEAILRYGGDGGWCTVYLYSDASAPQERVDAGGFSWNYGPMWGGGIADSSFGAMLVYPEEEPDCFHEAMEVFGWGE